LRALNVTELQTKSPVFDWSPAVDNDIIVAPLYQLYEQRRFRQVPVIYGSTTDEGTKNVDKTVTASTLDATIRTILGNISDAQLAELKTAYPASLNNVTFSGAVLNASYPGAGDEWHRLAAMFGEGGVRCIAYFHSDMHDVAGNTANWHYHYDVLDPRDAANGNRVYHTVELNAIWGPNNTDGNPPPYYYISNKDGGIADIVPIMQSYWISFIRTFDPNKLRMPGLAEWTPWTLKDRHRLLFNNNGIAMETMADAERKRCALIIPYVKAVNAFATPLKTLPPFANGTFPDPYQ
jgi:carboxylesterase type B